MFENPEIQTKISSKNLRFLHYEKIWFMGDTEPFRACRTALESCMLLLYEKNKENIFLRLLSHEKTEICDPSVWITNSTEKPPEW